MSDGSATVDINEVGAEKAMLRLLLSIGKFRGDWTTALALEGVADEIRRRVVVTGEGTISTP
ncbi:hypothetical protein ACKFKG_03160 [Phormidesmis sp. 146-35]